MALKKFFMTIVFFSLFLDSFVAMAGSMKPFKQYIITPNERSLNYILQMKPAYIVKVIKALKKSKAINRSEKKLKNTQLLMEKIEENIASLDKIKKEKKSYSIFLLGGFKSWQDSFNVNESNLSVEHKSMNRGPCVGGGLEYGNALWRLSAEGCGGFVSTFSNTAFETGLSMWYLTAELAGRYFLNDHSAIGMGVPIIFRSADFLLPADATSVDGISFFNFGANVKYYYDISKRFQFSMGIGGILGSGALSWSNGLRFYF